MTIPDSTGLKADELEAVAAATLKYYAGRAQDFRDRPGP